MALTCHILAGSFCPRVEGCQHCRKVELTNAVRSVQLSGHEHSENVRYRHIPSVAVSTIRIVALAALILHVCIALPPGDGPRIFLLDAASGQLHAVKIRCSETGSDKDGDA